MQLKIVTALSSRVKDPETSKDKMTCRSRLMEETIGVKRSPSLVECHILQVPIIFPTMNFNPNITLILLAAACGLVKGIIEGIPRDFSLPKKLLLNNFFNSAGK